MSLTTGRLPRHAARHAPPSRCPGVAGGDPRWSTGAATRAPRPDLPRTAAGDAVPGMPLGSHLRDAIPDHGRPPGRRSPRREGSASLAWKDPPPAIPRTPCVGVHERNGVQGRRQVGAGVTGRRWPRGCGRGSSRGGRRRRSSSPAGAGSSNGSSAGARRAHGGLVPGFGDRGSRAGSAYETFGTRRGSLSMGVRGAEAILSRLNPRAGGGGSDGRSSPHRLAA
jgi:hypothetical protein